MKSLSFVAFIIFVSIGAWAQPIQRTFFDTNINPILDVVAGANTTVTPTVPAVDHRRFTVAADVSLAYVTGVSNNTFVASNILWSFTAGVSNNVLSTSNVLQAYSLAVSNNGWVGSNALWGFIDSVSNNVLSTSNVLQSYSLAVSNNQWAGSNSLNIYITGVSNNTWVGSNALWMANNVSSNALWGFTDSVSNNVITTSNVLQSYSLAVSNWAYNSSNVLWGYTTGVSNNVITTSNILWGYTSGTSNNVITTSNILWNFTSGTSNNVITTSNVLWTYANASSNAVWVYANGVSNNVYQGSNVLWGFANAVSNKFMYAFTGTSNYLQKATGTNSLINSAVYETGGNVGIGTTGPQTTLDVASANAAVNSRGNLFVDTTDALGIDIGGQISLGGKYSSGDVARQFAGIAGRKETGGDGNGGGYMALYTASQVGATMAEKVRIDSTGNVGIKTTGPNTTLDVNGWINWSGQKRTTGDFSKTTDTALATVTGLSVTTVAGRTYSFVATLYVDADATGGHKYAIGGTTTATSIIYHVDSASDTRNLRVITSRATALATAVGDGGNGDTALITTITGTITVNLGGTLVVQFAQNASSGTSTVKQGSTFVVNDVN